MRTVTRSPNIMAIAARSAAALAFVLGLASAAMAQIPGALSQKSPDAAESVARVQQNGRVRIIVMFQAPASVSEVRPESESIAAAKAQVAAIKDAIIAAHFGSATAPRPGPDFARGLTRFEITPGFAVTVTRAELEALAAYPNGASINYDRAVPPSLIDSVPLIGMPKQPQPASNASMRPSIIAWPLGSVVIVRQVGIASSNQASKACCIGSMFSSTPLGRIASVQAAPRVNPHATGRMIVGN
jgi:hypothetical protein